MSIFDPQAFMNEELPETPETDYPRVPAGTYRATITKYDVRQHAGEDKKGNPYEIYFLELLWSFDDPGVVQEHGVEYVKQSIKLNVVMGDDGGFKLEKGLGKNVPLGQLQTALGMVGKGTSFHDFMGKSGDIQVTVDAKGFNQVKAVHAAD